MHRTFVTLSLIASLAACGGSSETGSPGTGISWSRAGDDAVEKPAPQALAKGSAEVTGAVNGATFTPYEAVFAEGSFAGIQPGLMVALGEQPGLCESLKTISVPRNSRFLGFGMFRADAEAPGADTYLPPTSDAENQLVAQFYQFDANCSNAEPNGKLLVAADGQLKLTQVVHGDSALGTFRIVLEEGAEPVTGAFHATFCDAEEILEAGGFNNVGCLE